MKQYPVLDIIVKWGGAIALLVAAAIFSCGAYISIALNTAIPIVVSVPVAIACGFLLKSYAEIVSVLSDMLIPK